MDGWGLKCSALVVNCTLFLHDHDLWDDWSIFPPAASELIYLFQYFYPAIFPEETQDGLQIHKKNHKYKITVKKQILK